MTELHVAPASDASPPHGPARSAVHHARLPIPVAVLGVRCDADSVIRIDFLPGGTPALAPTTPLAREACRQLEAYVKDGSFRFDLPLRPEGTEHARRVWRAMLAVPSGEVRTYGDLAAAIGSNARAVGAACGDNPIPVVIPCHRVVAKDGLGGFMHRRGGDPMLIKRWLLDHERGEFRLV